MSHLRVVEPVVVAGQLAEWHGWMQAAGMSGRTIADRLMLIGRFERDLGHDPSTADWRDIAAFLSNERFSAGTRQTYHGVFRSWFQWLVLMDYRTDDPTMKLRKPRSPRRRPRPLTVAQLGRVLSQPMHRRTRWMILLGAYQGLRVHEIAKVRAEHVRGGTFRVIGKGGVDSDLPLHELVAAVAMDAPRVGFWFPSHTKLGPIQGKSVSHMIGQVMQRAGVPGTAHALRHFYGTEALRSAGGNIRVAQELMRHANIASTAQYTQVDDAERRAAVDGLPVPLYAIRS